MNTIEEKALQPNHATWAILQEVFKPDGDANAVLYAAHRLQQFHGDDIDAPIKPGPRSYVMLTNSGHWGRGNTPVAAALEAKRAGARNGDHACLVLVLNDSTPEVNEAGMVISNCDSAQLQIGMIGTIGSILRVNPKS